MQAPKQNIAQLIAQYNGKRDRLLDMLHDVQNQSGFISDEVIGLLAKGLNTTVNDILETASFYHFFHRKPSGQHSIYVSDTVLARQRGYTDVLFALEQATGAAIGSTDASGQFGLFETSCIGLSDQEPAMMVDDVVFTELTPEKARHIVEQLKKGKSAEQIANPLQHPHHTQAYVEALVKTNVQLEGKVYFGEAKPIKDVLTAMVKKSSQDMLLEVKDAGVLGRGGAGFPAWRKWQLVKDTPGSAKYIICNADEGEPGTFKDRILLTLKPELVFLGMVCAAWAVGVQHGVIYLRYEYQYLKAYLEHVLDTMRADNCLGRNIVNQAGFDFDIRIQMGAGSYVCGDESALIESMEGKRGSPRVKPPLPAVKGYLNQPTVVNNVETLASVGRVVEMGGAWYKHMGTEHSTGTRLISVSGDCARAGVYEIEWGMTLKDFLDLVGAADAYAIQLSGASGECINVAENLQRRIAMEDLACGGALMIWNKERDLFEIARQFQHFFVEESCGICTPCRAGGVAMLQKAERFVAGTACQKDIDDVIGWEKVLRSNSRCGLGMTLSRPLLTTIQQFPQVAQAKLVKSDGPLLPSFNAKKSIQECAIVAQELMACAEQGSTK